MIEMTKNPTKRMNYFKAIMFFITIGFTPLVVYYAVIPIGPEETYMMLGEEQKTDMFSYYKSWTFAVCTFILGLNTLWDFVADNLGFDYKKLVKNPFTIGYAVFFVVTLIVGVINNVSGGGPAPSNQTTLFLFLMLAYGAIFLPQVLIASFGPNEFRSHIPKPVAVVTVIFLMAVFVSTALTDYRYITYHGAIERCESVFALLGYIIILVEVAEFASRKRESRVVFAALVFSASAIGIIGFFQLIGMDFFNTDLANRIVLGRAYDEGVRLSPRFRQAYATLYNPNCVGMYSAMMGPLALAAALVWPRKSVMKYILFGTALFGIICLFGSNSSAGLVGSAIAFGSLVAIIFANFIKNKRSMRLFLIAGALIVVAGVVALAIPAINSRIVLMARKVFEMPMTDEERGFARNLKLDGSTAQIFKGENSISITIDEGRVIVKDAEGAIVESSSLENLTDGAGGTATYSGLEGWPDFSLNTYGATVSYKEDGFTQHFGVDSMGNLLALTRKGEVTDLNNPPRSIGFAQRQGAASSRGYIWSKTLPIMLDYVLIGSGVDSYIMVFPQDDVLGKTRFFSNPYIIVDKPHNMYMQTAVNTGFISLLAQFSMFAIFLFWAVKKLITTQNIGTQYYAALLGCTVGVIGYLVTGLSTDSTVSVSPIFWAVLGLGYACIHALNHNLE